MASSIGSGNIERLSLTNGGGSETAGSVLKPTAMRTDFDHGGVQTIMVRKCRGLLRTTALTMALVTLFSFVHSAVRADSTVTNSISVEFWPPPGVYTDFVAVVLSTKQGLAHYTLDGTDPQPGSSRYWEPILITSDSIIKATAFKNGQPTGPVVTQHFGITTNQDSSFSSRLPMVIVNTLGAKIKVWDRIPAWITFFGLTNGESSISAPVEYSGRAQIAIRGNSSTVLPKKSYRIELQNEMGEDLKVSLSGMPRESDWVLFAGYNDRTLIRDTLAYSLWRQMGYYAPRFRFVELFVVETNRSFSLIEPTDYRGVYVLIEKIKRGKSRVAVEKLEKWHDSEPEISGGYILKRDRPNPGEQGFRTSRGIHLLFEEPKEREISSGQSGWLTNYVNRLETSLFAEEFSDPIKGYKAYLDTASFIDFHWMVELGRNPDGYGVSIYLHKERGERLKVGPIWDWDLSFGSVILERLIHVEGWEFERTKYPFYTWYSRMFEDPDFLQAYIDRWSELRQTVFATTNLHATVDGLAANLVKSQARNFQRWPTLRGSGQTDREQLYREQVEALKRWLAARVDWIDHQCMTPPLAKVSARNPTGQIVELMADAGTIHYTLDGLDPRLPEGKLLPHALQYREPIPLNGSEQIYARIRSEFNLWSAPLIISNQATTRANHGLNKTKKDNEK